MAGGNYFDIAIATLFAVEFLEGSIIVGQYRTILLRLPEWADRQKEGLRCIYRSAVLAILVALAIIFAVAIPLGLLAKELNPRIGMIIEGSSKFVAAFFIAMLSLKIPMWLGIYPRTKKERELGLTLKEIRFNVSWNIWREVIEIGVFLLPIVIGSGALAIPISALVGATIGLFGGAFIYFANQRMKSKKGLTIFMCLLLVSVSSGLIVGAVTELENVVGKTTVVWQVNNPFFSSYRLPMVLLKPFGYTSTRTLLQMCTYWCWLVTVAALHYWKYRRAMNAWEKEEAYAETDEENVAEEKDFSENDLDTVPVDGNSFEATESEVVENVEPSR